MKTPLFWYNKKSKLPILLFPLSIIWLLFFYIRNLIRVKYYFDVPIICVGNIIAGGGGKTPLILELCKILNKKNQVHVIYKAYKVNIKKQVVKVDSRLNANNVGDEPLLISKYATTWVCNKRKNGIKKAIKEGAKLILLDDGLQDQSIKKTLNILVANEIQGHGNSKIIPSGPLREKKSMALHKSDCIFFYGTKINFQKLFSNYKKNVFYGKIKSNLKYLKIKKNNKIVAFSGIAYPNNFYNLLTNNKLKVVKTISFEDHYKYKRKDIIKIINQSNEVPSSIILTTSKDYVKIPNDLKKYIREVKINVQFNKKILSKFIIGSIENSV